MATSRDILPGAVSLARFWFPAFAFIAYGFGDDTVA
jgi:hypothetical protein